MRRSHFHRLTRAFTLIEILVVVVVIGILAAIVVPRFSDAAYKAREQVALDFEQSLEKGVAMYVAAHGKAPPSFYSWVSYGGGTTRNYVRIDSKIRNQLANPRADVVISANRIKFVFPEGYTATYDYQPGGRIHATYSRN
ncbi:MAG: prepilin-type N-terminal cleavage/methylation domain-containing protein [Phycisphaerales bacterium]